MNSIEIKTLIKVITVCVVLFLFSPLIFSVVGIVFRGILWLIIAVVLTITCAIMYFEHKIKKEASEYYSMHEETVTRDDGYDITSEEVEIDYGNAPIVDVEDYEEIIDHQDEDSKEVIDEHEYIRDKE